MISASITFCGVRRQHQLGGTVWYSRPWFWEHGLRVTNTHAGRAVLDVAGSVDAIEKVFNVHIMRFQAGNGRVFHAPDAEPEFPAPIAGRVAGVVGLDDAVEPAPNVIMPPPP